MFLRSLIKRSSVADGGAKVFLLEHIQKRDPHQPLFHQAVEEVVESLEPVFLHHPHYVEVMKVLLEPERMVQFRVPWVSSSGKIEFNRGWRVQFNSAIGGYKGGLRFHPSVTIDTLKFLAFEQILKNSLTTLPMGGGKGGSDFDPKGKTEGEIRSFCQSFMTELQRHIGPDTDVPAGDIGVGGREIGYMYGQYRRMKNEYTGTLTGKGFSWGGSNIRPEATGYGLVYFWKYYMDGHGHEINGQRVAVSGSGNVAQFCAQKLIRLGAVPITFSDSAGYVYEPEGFDEAKLAKLFELKNVKRGRLAEWTRLSNTGKYIPNAKPWAEKCDWAMPSATQNEINEQDAKQLIKNGCKGVFEGANMGSTPGAIRVYEENNVAFGPGKATNAGGVAVSGLEMTQNAAKIQWKNEQVDNKLQEIMKDIYDTCIVTAREYGLDDNIKAGANIAGFLKVAEAMMDQGHCSKPTY